MHALQLLELALHLLQDRLGHLGLVRLLLEGGDLLRQLVALAQLALDGLELLAQEELALRAVHLPLGLRRDLLLHGQDFQLLGHQLVHAAEPLHGVDGLQDLLRPFHLEVEVAGREVGQAARLLHVGGDDDDLGRDGLAEVGGLLERGLDVAHQGLELQALLGRLRLLDGLDARLQERMAILEGLDARAAHALHEHADAAVGQLEHAHDERHRAHRVHVVGPRVLVVLPLLRRQQDHAVLGQGLVHGLDRPLAAHVEGHDHEREDHDVAQREDGEDLGDLRRLLLARRRSGDFVSHQRGSLMPDPPSGRSPPSRARGGPSAAGRSR